MADLDYSDVLQDLSDRVRQDNARNGQPAADPDGYPDDWDGIDY